MYTPTRFYLGHPGTVEGTLYTIPSQKKAIVKEILLTNISGSAATLSLSIVPSGLVAGDDNRILKGYSVPANNFITIPLSLVLNAGDFLSSLQGTSGAITAAISGVLIE